MTAKVLLLWPTLLSAGDDLSELDRKIAAAPAEAVTARIDAAQLRIRSGEQLDRALFDLDVARALVPENPRVHFLFGQLMEERGEAAAARAAYQTALALRDDYDDARFRLAGLLFHQGAFSEAAQAYARYVKTHPEASGARMQLAAALEQSGDKAAAEVVLKALYSDPRTKDLGGRRLADLYSREGREREAAKVRAEVEPPKRKLRDLKRSAR